MDSDMKMKSPQLPQLPVDSINFLSQVWCNTAIQVMQPAMEDRSIALPDDLIKMIKNDLKASPKMEVEGVDAWPLPRWKSDDLKSWIWLQKAIHPELNYDRCFHKRWSLSLPKKLFPFKDIFIRKWLKEMKQKRKEEERLMKAEVHAAVSIASVAAALAAVAADSVKENQPYGSKDAAVASAAALVAAQCAQMAEDIGADREQLSSAMGSAMSATGVSEILTLTAAAATSLRGAAALKARPGRKEKEKEEMGKQILPIDGNKGNKGKLDYGRYRALLENGSELYVKSPGALGRKLRFVSVKLDCHAKVILKLNKATKFKGFASTKERVVIDVHEDLHNQEDCHFIILTTSEGPIKLEMNGSEQYKIWIVTVNHLLMLSTSYSGYELQLYRN